jgi:hypothetical protein
MTQTPTLDAVVVAVLESIAVGVLQLDPFKTLYEIAPPLPPPAEAFVLRTIVLPKVWLIGVVITKSLSGSWPRKFTVRASD